MKKIVVLSSLILVIIVSLYFLNIKNNNSFFGTKISKPWIEIITNNVYELREDGKTINKNLFTGDELDENSIIKTDITGKAVVHFSDGSVLRLDKNSTIKLNEANFNEKTGSLRVNVSLFTGRVWSKIIGLTTDDSVWQVQTGSTVATVRGTAFSVEVDKNNKTKIFGSENTVSVDLIDENKNVIKTDLKINENEVLEINDEIIEEVSIIAKESEGVIDEEKLGNIVSIKEADEDTLSDEWIVESEFEDKSLEEKIDELKEEGLEDRDLREELKEVVESEIKERIKEEILNNDATLDKIIETREADIQTTKDLNTKETITEESVVKDSGTLNRTENVLVDSLKGSTLQVRTDSKLSEYIEGDRIKFDAVLIMPDQREKVVTADAIWSVVGDIGNFISPGILVARIPDNRFEEGIVIGGILVKYKYSDGEIDGKSEIITVVAKPPVLLENSGQ